MAVYEKWCQANNLKPSKNVQSEKYQQNAKLLCQVFMNGVHPPIYLSFKSMFFATFDLTVLKKSLL